MLKKLILAALFFAPVLASAQLPMQCGVQPGNSSVSGAKEPTTASRPAPPTPGPTTSCFEVQNIRVNVHFLQHDDGSGNFTATNDGRPGNPSTAMTGYDYAQGLLYACNSQMDQNAQLRLAPGSSLTPIPKRVRWLLDGVYFDRSSFYRNGAGTSTSPFRDYVPLCVRPDSVINIFLVEEADWPYFGPRGNTNVNNPVALPKTRGYVFSTNQAICDANPTPNVMWAVVSSPWTKYVVGNTTAYEMASAVNHELGHLLGLNHPHQYSAFNWGECPDAPMNANCWNLNEPSGTACDAWSEVSNNLMDYNADQAALSPCQVGIIQSNLNTCLKSRFVYKCSNCMPTVANFDLTPGTCGQLTNIWLDGRASWDYHKFKLEIDRLDSGGDPIVGTHYETTPWRRLGREQLDALYTFSPNSTYRVQVTTYNPCGATAVRVRTLSTSVCTSLTSPSSVPATVSIQR